MLVMKTVEVCICDFCEKEKGYKYNPCLRCGKHHCYDCKDNVIHYPHSTYASGSGDGYYCVDCDKLMEDDPQHIACVRIAELREEMDKVGRELQEKRRVAENELKKFIG